MTGSLSMVTGTDRSHVCVDRNLHVNVLLTAPLYMEFPNRQLIDGPGIVFEGQPPTVEVTNTYNVNTSGFPRRVLSCLANSQVRACIDGEEVDNLLGLSKKEHVTGGIVVSGSNQLIEYPHVR